MAAEADRHRNEIERLHEGMVVEIDRRFTSRGERPGWANKNRDAAALEEEVTSTISVIRQASSALGELQETIRRQEELIYEQRQALADLQHQKQEAHVELAEVERVAKAERERAEKAESQLQGGEAQIKRLEDYSVSLKSHLNSLMAAVRESLSGNENK